MIRVSTLAMTAVLALFGASACGEQASGPELGDSVASNGPRTASVESSDATPVSSQTCSDLLDDDVVAAFGWSMPAAAGESSGRCERSASGDVLTVGERLDLSAGHDQEARTSYQDACSALAQKGGGVVDADTDWLGDHTEACLKEFGAGQDTGVATMYVLTDDLALIQVQVVAGSSTPLDQLRGGLTELVDGVQTTW